MKGIKTILKLKIHLPHAYLFDPPFSKIDIWYLWCLLNFNNYKNVLYMHISVLRKDTFA